MEENKALEMVEQNDKKTLALISGVLALISIAVCLVVVFFIGIQRITIHRLPGYYGIPGSETVRITSTDMYHYFSNGFDIEISEEYWNTKAFIAPYKSAMTTNTIAVICSFIVTVVAIVVFSVLSAIVYLQSLLGNKKKDATKWCVATVLSFWTGTALIKSLHIYETSKVATSLNAITCVGLVVSVVLISLALVFRFAAKAKESFSGRDLVKYFSGFVFLVLSLVIFGVLKHGALTVTTFKDGEPYLREMQHPLQLASDIIADIGMGTTRYNGSVDPNLTLSYFSDIKLYAIFLTIFQALSFCLVAFVLFRVLGGKKVGEIVWGLLLIGTVGVLVFALLLRGACIDVNLYVDKTQITMTYGWCIVLVALSFVGLVASILAKLLFKKAKE